MNSVWPSFETASFVHDVANWFLIGALVIGVIATFLVVWMGSVKEEYLKHDIASTQERAANAELRAAEANEKAEAERLSRLKLEKQLEPRRLSGSQKELLVKLLATRHDAVAIVSSIQDAEGSDFADDFDSALTDAGWKTLRIRNHISLKYGVSVGTVTGTVLFGAKQLSDALTSLEIAHDAVSFSSDDHSMSPWFEAGVIYLVIEHKPVSAKAETETK